MRALPIPPSVGLGAGIAVAAALGIWIAVKSGAAAKLTAGTLEAISPLNANNVFARGVNAVGAELAGDPGWNLGGWIWEHTHPGSVTAEGRAVYGDPTARSGPQPVPDTSAWDRLLAGEYGVIAP